MTHIVADRIKVTTTTTGTGAYVLSNAVSSFRSFSSVMSDANTCFYLALLNPNWEVGIGTWHSDNTLTRTTVQASSNGGAAVNWPAGTKHVSMVDPAAVNGALTGDITKSADSSVTVLANMPAGTVKGRRSGTGTGAPVNILNSELRSDLAAQTSLTGIAALRAVTSATLPDTTAEVLAWTAGANGKGGGTFNVDPADTTSADDSGLTIRDSTVGTNRRWKRALNTVLTPLMFGCVGDGATDDTAAFQLAIAAGEALAAAGWGVTIDGLGRNYGLTNELNRTAGDGLAMQNFRLSALASGVWATTPYTSADIPDLAGRSNLALWCRDLTNAAWAKTTTTAAKTATGIDSVANAATRLTATGGNATTLQTVSSANNRVFSAFVKGVTITGNIQMTTDGATGYTTLNPAPTVGQWRQYTVTKETITNPVCGFRIVNNGDIIEVDYCQEETADSLLIPSPPLLTTTTAATRTMSSKYLIRNSSGALYSRYDNIQFDCNDLCGGIFVDGFIAEVNNCKFDDVTNGIGVRINGTDEWVRNCIITGNASPWLRNSGIGIYVGTADVRVCGNTVRYCSMPLYIGQDAELDGNYGANGRFTDNHFYNGNGFTLPDSSIIYLLLSGGGGHTFASNYFDNGRIDLGTAGNSFWGNKLAWNSISSPYVFGHWTSNAGDNLTRFGFKGLNYNTSNLSSVGTSLFALKTKGAGTWSGINSAIIAAFQGSADFSPEAPSFVSNHASLFGNWAGRSDTPLLMLYALQSSVGVGIGVDSTGGAVDDLVFQTNSLERWRLAKNSGVETLSTNANPGRLTKNVNNNSTSGHQIEGSKAGDGASFAEVALANRADTGAVDRKSVV